MENSALLEKIDRNKAAIATSRVLTADEMKALNDYFRIELTYTSNALEGNSLTLSETKSLLEDGITVGGKPIRDCYETTGHARAYDYMLTLARSCTTCFTAASTPRKPGEADAECLPAETCLNSYRLFRCASVAAAVIAFPALRQLQRTFLVVISARPAADALQDRHDRAALFRQRVFDARRDLLKLFSLHDPFRHQLAQSGGEDRVGDIRHLAAQIAVTQRLLFRKHADDARLPFAAQRIHAHL